MEAIIVLFVTLCPVNTDRCYRTIQSSHTSMEECYIDLSMDIQSASITRHLQCITQREAVQLLASNAIDRVISTP